MENIILTNNKDLRLVGVKVGVLSTLRFELPLVSASATHVEVIVTSGDVHSAYTATFIDATKCWQCDIAASQFPTVGKQSYEIAYVLDGKQFWDGKGWIEIEDATTSGIEPQPRPEPYRYAVVSVNGYGADAQGAVRIPKTFTAANSPATTEGYMEGDIYFNRETGATWTLCNVQGTLTWVFNYKNYYTKAETDEAIDRVAAYYITYDAAGNPFPTYASLANAQTVYSGGAVRVPTRNDYCVVLADETHQGAEYRYIYAVAEGQTTGSWQPQFPVGGVMTVDQTVTKNSANPVAGGGVWSAIWGTATTAFSSLYDWCVAQLAGKVPTSRTVNNKALSADVTLTANDIDYAIPGGAQSVQMTLESVDAALAGKANRASPATAGNLAALDANGNPTDSGVKPSDKLDSTSAAPAWVSGTTYTVNALVTYNGVVYCNANGGTFVSNIPPSSDTNWAATKVSDLFLPLTGGEVSGDLTVDGSVNLSEFFSIYRILPSGLIFRGRINNILRTALLPLFTISDSSISTIAFLQRIAPDYNETYTYELNNLCVHSSRLYRCTTAITTAEVWTAAHWTEATVEDVLAALRTGKADKPATFTAGNLAKFDANGNPTDSGVKASDKLDSTSAAPAFSSDSSVSYPVGSHVTYNGKLYKCTTATTGGTWVAGSWAEDTMTDPDATLDITAQNQLRVVAKDGTILWAQGYDLASTSSATLACDAQNNFTFADGATTQAFTLPTAPTGKVGDFGLDIDNSANTSAAMMTLTGLDKAFSVVIPKGANLNDMLAIAAGELAQFYVTLTTFRVNNLPTWHIVKQIVENGGAQS